ncbi:hypothetical protein IFM89_031300 [Coptis chinensis]|uniref:Glucose-methanol-choline oxidoreductase N-terminal domain-containing protein n=1 Tax=Coptis chinensis TaxID=261450 RepID=A0A835J2Z8_9MAGN|nr:hypothetical protein IFM89_031300 [Coptis chinensis]
MTQGHGVLNIISDVQQVQSKYFDYIVVGGGTSGCPLTQHCPKRYRKLLVERGGSPFEDPFIMEKKNFFSSLRPQLNEFTSIIQKFESEEGVANYRGRVLGGTTAINGGVYTRSNKEYIERAGWDGKLVKEAYEWVESKVIFEPKELTKEQSYAKDIFVGAGILPFNGYSLEHVEGTKITGEGTKPRACGIRFIKSHEDLEISYEVYLNCSFDGESWGDVVLCAGTMGSPQILMLSGIGPSEHLVQFNITPMVNAPQVGQDVKDHPGIIFMLDVIDVPQAYGDPSQVIGITNNSKFLFQYGGGRLKKNKQLRSILGKLAYPRSKGIVKLNSIDPRKNPSVKFNYLLEEKDLDGCVEMVHEMKKIARSMDSVLGTNYSEKIDIVISGLIYISTEDAVRVGSVVDKDHKVFGVEGVRVVDASALSDLMSTSPMGTLLMLGRYQGTKMLRERGME